MGLVHKPDSHQRGLTLIEHAPRHRDGLLEIGSSSGLHQVRAFWFGQPIQENSKGHCTEYQFLQRLSEAEGAKVRLH